MATADQFQILSDVLGVAQATAVVNYVDAQIAKNYVDHGIFSAQIASLQEQQDTPPFPINGLRNLNTDFIVSVDRNAEVRYTIETTTAATSAGAIDDQAMAELYINGVSVHSARNRITATLTAILGLLGISISANVQRWTLSGYVPAGQTVQIVTSGTGTVALISVQEVLQ